MPTPPPGIDVWLTPDATVQPIQRPDGGAILRIRTANVELDLIVGRRDASRIADVLLAISDAAGKLAVDCRPAVAS